ncbi:MAG TPA: HNH endonuclease domain-containing protein [Cyclobacteriaceae bacterium]|nr:HNH endonuclease domain-containing protein [Cyclobacteriaceae bacterium]
MNKIFGLDLGTNSIGWALRNPVLAENQIEKFGVLTFNKGVGLGKTGEFSYAAERTKKRSTRRLYQARKYRLWATLEVLITEGYCPLSIDDLNKWRHYNKEEAVKNNNAGRVYPVNNSAFDAWIKLDFDNDGKPDYTSPYQLRKELAEIKLDFTKEQNRFKLGRALYHIAQRRGFKSSRKGADDSKENETNDNEVIDLQYSEKKKNKAIAELFEKYTNAKTIGWLFALLEKDKIRIRESITQYAIRENYKDEIKFIFQTQELKFEDSLYTRLVETGNNKNDGSIFYKRPLRSQKGLVGKCTLEPNKYRVPISHPAFETFRAWAFLNNIKYKENNEWKQLPIELKQEIYTELFFRKSKSYFPFSEIVAFIKKKGASWQLNYSPKTTVTACPVSARLKDIFGDDYLNVKIEKAKAPKSDKAFYNIEDIWHVLFSYEDQEYIADFAEQKLKLEPEKIKQFVTAWNACPVGYGMLSLNAINKINVFLQKGLIYTEAVLLANIPEILGKGLWQQNETLLLDSISEVIAENRQQKTILNIANNLVSKHKYLEANEQFGRKDNNYKLVESDLYDIQTAIEDQFGALKWNSFPEDEKKIISDTVKDCYQAYFAKQGIIRDTGNEERIVTVQSNGKKYYKTESGYYRLPKLIDTLKEFFQDNFEHLSEKKLSKIYHPSEINIYPPAKPDKDGVLKLGSPKTSSFKNPMAMRTLHELRKLMNYMIESNQINSETRVVVEVARELNDANKRWAIETWQRQREAENQEFAEAIKQLLNEDGSIKANAESADDIDKVRLFYEQNVEQTLPEVAETEEDEKGRKKRKKSTQKDEAIRWKGHGKNLIDKFRLWKEQGYQCLYTGRFIKLADLFNENVIDFEHTLPRSKSFDNSLANLTVCYADYNRTVKKNQIPTQLPNYEIEHDFGGKIGKCSAIQPRLEVWEEKVKRIKQQIDFWITKSKKAADKGWKDDAIRQRHLWKMELDYWQNKLDRFTITEITSGFKNSQKVDTQLISKYAFHYLKTYFDKVDVQKGSITAEFRKIYQLQASDEKKDRSKHSHHAKDAAVLTLIPVAAQRDAILERYYEAKEKNPKATFTEEPYKGFKREFVWNIDDNVLINNIANNQELTPAKRKVRKRGKEVFIEKPDGTKVNKWATGDSIRGQLHQETFYGAIKPAKKGDKGNLLKDEDGKFIQEESLKYVLRVPFTADFTGVDKIVDEGLKKQIKEHAQRAGSFKKAFEEGIYLLDKNGKPHGNRIRHIRVWASVSEPLAIKKQTNLSDKEYKQSYWAANATNSFFAIYKGEDRKDFDFRSLFDSAKIKSINPVKNPKDLFEAKITITKGKKVTELPLTYILEVGTKVIFRKDEKEDLKSLSNSELLKRLYVYTRFEKDGRINFKYHLEARSDSDITERYKDSSVNFENPLPTLRLVLNKCNFLVEGYDFDIKMDGTIKWK